MNKILIGIIIGIFATVAISFLYRTCWLHDYLANPIQIEKSDTTKNALLTAVNQIKSAHANIEEKFSSINKRLDDFLVFGGIIITLLLAVTVSVYLKTETEVNKHFKDNFEKYEKIVVESTNRVQTAAEKVLAYEELVAAKAIKIIEDNAPISK